MEKARALHQLFPYEMTAFIKFVWNMSKTMQEDEHKTIYRNRQENLQSLIVNVDDAILKIGKNLNTNSNLFATYLFDTTTAPFTIHCLKVYTTIRKHKDVKFCKTVDLLFNP